MQKKNSLAVVIPYYKIDFFENTLKSLASQTDKRFHVYIGNDNSPADPEKLINQYTTLINISYQKFDDNIGSNNLTKQWERCIEMVRDEEWLMLLGDDDYLDNNVVEEFYSSLHNVEVNGYNLIRYASQVVDENNFSVSKIFYNHSPQAATEHLVTKYEGFTRSSLSEHIFRKKSYLKYRFINYPLAWHSDDMAWLQFTEFGKAYCTNSAIVHIRTSESSITGSSENQNIKNKATLLFFTDLLTIYRVKFTSEEIIKIELALDLYVYDKKHTIPQVFKKYNKQMGFLAALLFLIKRLKHAVTWRIKRVFLYKIVN